jgi:hypothetical protein
MGGSLAPPPGGSLAPPRGGSLAPREGDPCIPGGGIPGSPGGGIVHRYSQGDIGNTVQLFGLAFAEAVEQGNGHY